MATHRARGGRIVETVQRNIFRNPLTGALDKVFLRHSAVRRLFERGRISASRAAELLLCKPGIRNAVVASWTDLAGDPA